MGKFTYDSGIKADFEDRLLAHLQAVIMSKVRRGESFHFTWTDNMSTGGGRTAVYVQPGVSMAFRFHGGRTPPLNSAWLHALTYNANTSRGLYIVPEPEGATNLPARTQEMVFREVPLTDPAPAQT